MIAPAPTEFWQLVVARVAVLLFERETALGSAGVRLTPVAERRPGPVETTIEIGKPAA